MANQADDLAALPDLACSPLAVAGNASYCALHGDAPDFVHIDGNQLERGIAMTNEATSLEDAANALELHGESRAALTVLEMERIRYRLLVDAGKLIPDWDFEKGAEKP